MENFALHSDTEPLVLASVADRSRRQPEAFRRPENTANPDATAKLDGAGKSAALVTEDERRQCCSVLPASSSPHEVASQKRSSWLPFFNWGSSLLTRSRVTFTFSSVSHAAGSSSSPFTEATSSNTSAARDFFSSSSSSDAALRTISRFKEEDFECAFFDSPFSTADSRYFPSDGNPQHAVFRNSQGLRLHAYFWFPSCANEESAGRSPSDSDTSCGLHCTPLSFPASGSFNADASPTDLCTADLQRESQQHERAVHQQQQQQHENEPQQQQDAAQQRQGEAQQQDDVDVHQRQREVADPQQQGDGTTREYGQEQEEEKDDAQRKTKAEHEWERACGAARARGIIVVLHGYCGHGRLAYLKKILPKDYIRQHPSWGTYIAAPDSSSCTPSSSFFSPARPVENEASIDSAHQRGTAAAALAAALAPCDIIFPHQRLSCCLSQHPIATASPKDDTTARAAAGVAPKNGFAAAAGPENDVPAAAATAEEMPEQTPAALTVKESSGLVTAEAAAAARRDERDHAAGAATREKETCEPAKAIALTAANAAEVATAGTGDIGLAKEEEKDEEVDERGRGDVKKRDRNEETQQHPSRDNCSEVGPKILYSGSWVEAFNKAGYIVAALDMQGHGLSEGWEGRPATVRCFDDFAVDVFQFLYIARNHCRRLRAAYQLRQKKQQKKQQPEQPQQQQLQQQHKLQHQRKQEHLWIQLAENGKDGDQAAVQDGKELLQNSAATLSGNPCDAARVQHEAAEAAKRDAAAIVASEGETRDASERFEEERGEVGEREGERGRTTNDPRLFLMGLSLGGAVALRTVQLFCEAAADPVIAPQSAERRDEDGKQVTRREGERGEERGKKGEGNAEDGNAGERGGVREKEECLQGNSVERRYSRSPAAGACPVPGRSHMKGKEKEIETHYFRHTEESNFLNLSGCILLSPMLDLDAVKSGGAQSYRLIVKPALRMLKKWLPHAVVTGAHAYVKYPFQQQMMMQDPYTYKGGIRATMAYEMLDATEQLLSQQRLAVMQQHASTTRCPPLLLVQNIFDTTCGFRGCLNLFQGLSALRDKTFLLLNAFVMHNNSRSTGTHSTEAHSCKKTDNPCSSADKRNTAGEFNCSRGQLNSITGALSRSSSREDSSCRGRGDNNSRADSNIADSNRADSNIADSNRAHSNKVDCNRADNSEVDSKLVDSNRADSNEADSVNYLVGLEDPGCQDCDCGSRAAATVEVGHEDLCVHADSKNTSKLSAAASTSGSEPLSAERAAENKGSTTEDTLCASETPTLRSCRAGIPSVNDTAVTAKEEINSSRRSRTAGSENIGNNTVSPPLHTLTGENTDDRSICYEFHSSGNDVHKSDIDEKDISTEEMAYEVFLRSLPHSFNLDYATLKALQVYADPDLNELDVFHSLPSDPEGKKVLQRVKLWVLQHSQLNTPTDTAAVSI